MEELLSVFHKHGFGQYRMIGGSKSGYRSRHEGHDILFNANIFTKEEHLVWGGDLNLTLDASKLQRVSNDLDRELIVTSEMMGRFGAEDRPIEAIIATSHAIFTPGKGVYQRREYGREFEGTTIGNCTMIGCKRLGFEEVEIIQPE